MVNLYHQLCTPGYEFVNSLGLNRVFRFAGARRRRSLLAADRALLRHLRAGGPRPPLLLQLPLGQVPLGRHDAARGLPGQDQQRRPRLRVAPGPQRHDIGAGVDINSL